MKAIIIIICCIIGTRSLAQSAIDQAVNYWLQYQPNETSYEHISESLIDYLATPLSINKVSKTELEAFPLFHFQQVNTILQYLKWNDNILSWSELNSIPYFNKEFITVIQPFLSLSQKDNLPRSRFSFLFKTNIPLEKPKGFINPNDSSQFIGNWLNSAIKFKGSWRKNYLGVFYGKGLGENYLSRANTFKVSYQLKLKSRIQQVNIGSYSLHLGSGLIHSNNFMNQFQNLQQIIVKPNTSSNPSNYLNGFFLQTKYRILKTGIGLSYRNIHGSISNESFTSIKENGLFQNKNDYTKLNQGNHFDLFLIHQINLKKLKVNLNHKASRLSRPYAPKLNYYNQINRTKPQIINSSISYNFHTSSLNCNGEIATDYKDFALTQSLQYSINEEFQFETNLRFFGPKYSSRNSNTVQKNTTVKNERGGTFNLHYFGNNNHSILSVDLFKHQLPKFQNHLPSFGKTITYNLQHQASDSCWINLRYRYKYYTRDTFSNNLDYRSRIEKHEIKGRIKFTPFKSIVLNTRFGWNIIHGLQGYFCAQDIKYSIKNNSSFSIRFAFTNTNSWENRFYSYEADMLYNYTVPVYYDKSFKTYLLYSYKLNYNWGFWCKYDLTYFPNKTEIGSGNLEINGNVKTHLKWQIRFRF